MAAKTLVYKTYAREHSASRYLGDCSQFVKNLPDGEVDLVAKSPPYCIEKNYESTQDVRDFVSFHERLLPEILRATKDGGSICWQVGHHVSDKVVLPLGFLVLDSCRKIQELKLRNRIVWTFGHGLHATERFTGRHETVLWFTKGDNYFFNLDAVRVPQRYPGKKAYKGLQKPVQRQPIGEEPE
jgi:adenine-specific DNA-methyltransferase